MKKLSQKVLDMGADRLLTRNELKKVVGGSADNTCPAGQYWDPVFGKCITCIANYNTCFGISYECCSQLCVAYAAPLKGYYCSPIG